MPRSGYAKFFLLAVILVPGLSLISCGGWAEKPGAGPRAEHGFAAAFPVTEALENYRNDYGKYPQNLDELVPKYLAQTPPQNEASEVRFTYYPDSRGETFRLRFSYEIPMGGMDECSFTPEVKKWNCGGKF